VDRLPDVLHVLRHGVRDVDLELRFEGKEDVDGIERVDSQLGKRRIQFDDAGLKVLFTCDDVDHFFGYVVFHGLLSPLSRFDFRAAHRLKWSRSLLDLGAPPAPRILRRSGIFLSAPDRSDYFAPTRRQPAATRKGETASQGAPALRAPGLVVSHSH